MYKLRRAISPFTFTSRAPLSQVGTVLGRDCIVRGRQSDYYDAKESRIYY